MAIRHDQSSAYVQERRKWEMRPTIIDPQWVGPQTIDGKIRAGFMDGTYIEPIPVSEGGRGGAPLLDYPRMLYKATRQDGGPKCDIEGGTGYIIAEDERHEQRLAAQGWHRSQQEAMDAIKAEDREWAKLAAERNFETRRMSEKARAEVQAHDDASSNHLPSIPETPIKRRGRPVKVKETV